jgi:hypothetical protein
MKNVIYIYMCVCVWGGEVYEIWVGLDTLGYWTKLGASH